VLNGIPKTKLRQLNRFLDFYRVGQPREVHHVHRVANCRSQQKNRQTVTRRRRQIISVPPSCRESTVALVTTTPAAAAADRCHYCEKLLIKRRRPSTFPVKYQTTNKVRLFYCNRFLFYYVTVARHTENFTTTTTTLFVLTGITGQCCKFTLSQ